MAKESFYDLEVQIGLKQCSLLAPWGRLLEEGRLVNLQVMTTWIPEIIIQTLIFIVKETLAVALAGQNPLLVPGGPSVAGQRVWYK